MKTKIITFFALMLCMGAFLLPVSAYAATDTTPPTVKAELSGDVLRIEATDAGTGVDAVYINDIRFNYRVDGVLQISAKDYAGTGKVISVYAVDFAGNKSEPVKITNPYYTAPAATPAPTQQPAATQQPVSTPTPTQATPEPSAEPSESAIPPETTDGQAFTPDGTGTVVDDIVEQNGKEFFSITTEAGNVFYLIIDRQRDSENVYLLNAVTEDDLAALAEKSDKKSESAVPTPPAETKTPEPTETEKPAETPPKEESGNSGMFIFLVLGVLAAGGAGYYFKIVKPKRDAIPDEDYEDDEEMEFEDEPEESDDADDGVDYESETEDE